MRAAICDLVAFTNYDFSESFTVNGIDLDECFIYSQIANRKNEVIETFTIIKTSNSFTLELEESKVTELGEGTYNYDVKIVSAKKKMLMKGKFTIENGITEIG